MSSDPKEAMEVHDAKDPLGELLASAVLDDGAGPAPAKPYRELREQALSLMARDATLRARRRMGLCAIGVAAALAIGFVAPTLLRRGTHGEGPQSPVGSSVALVSAPAEDARSLGEKGVGVAVEPTPRSMITVDVSTLPPAPLGERAHRGDPVAAKDPKLSNPPAPMPSPTEAEDLLRTANRLRGERRWEEAMRTYERVIREHPDSDPAYAAVLAAASLRLSRAGDAREALRLYERALALHPAGELSEEALWGTCVAHRALGQHREERDALQRFTAKYPSSWRASEAAERLSQTTEPPR